MSWAFTVDAELAGICRPVWAFHESVHVRSHDGRLDEPLREATHALRTAAEAAQVTTAVRAMYRRFGVDPTKTRPSSEALLRRLRKGDELPRINNLVDVINWSSVESQLPFGLYDLGHVVPPIVARLGLKDEAYAGIRKDVVHLEGRVVVADASGPFGNPTSDSARTMVTEETRRCLVLIFAPSDVDAARVATALDRTRHRIAEYCL